MADGLGNVLQSFCYVFHAILRAAGVIASALLQSLKDTLNLVLEQRHGLGSQGGILALRCGLQAGHQLGLVRALYLQADLHQQVGVGGASRPPRALLGVAAPLRELLKESGKRLGRRRAGPGSRCRSRLSREPGFRARPSAIEGDSSSAVLLPIPSAVLIGQAWATRLQRAIAT